VSNGRRQCFEKEGEYYSENYLRFGGKICYNTTVYLWVRGDLYPFCLRNYGRRT